MIVAYYDANMKGFKKKILQRYIVLVLKVDARFGFTLRKPGQNYK
jgi:hypothetical protein